MKKLCDYEYVSQESNLVLLGHNANLIHSFIHFGQQSQNQPTRFPSKSLVCDKQKETEKPTLLRVLE